MTSATVRRTRLDPALVGAIAALSAIAGWRFAVALGIDGPATTDAGNWLAFGHDLLGPDVRSASITYPPLVPLLTVMTTDLFGLERGIALLVGACSVAPAVGMTWALRRLGLRWSATWIGVVTAMASSSGEAAAWGGFPQLLGLGVLPLLLWSLDDHLRDASPPRAGRTAWRTAALWFVLAATSHFVAAVAAVAGAVVVVLHLLLPPDGRADGGWGRARTGLWPLAAVSLPLVPWYLGLGVVGSAARGSGSVPATVDGLRHVVHDVPWLWLPAAVVALLTPIVAADPARGRPWVLATSVTAGSVVVTVVLADPRVAYLVPVAAGLSFGLLATETSSLPVARGPLVGVAMVLVAVAQVRAGVVGFRGQVQHHAVAAGGMHEVVTRLADGPEDVVVAVAPVRSAPVGWWVEGVSRRRTLPGGDPRWLYFPDEWWRAAVADAIFGPAFPTVDQFAVARSAGAAVLVLPSSGSAVDRSALDRLVTAGSAVVCMDRPDVLVVTLTPADGAGSGAIEGVGACP